MKAKIEVDYLNGLFKMGVSIDSSGFYDKESNYLFPYPSHLSFEDAVIEAYVAISAYKIANITITDSDFKELINEKYKNPELMEQLACSGLYFAFIQGAYAAKKILIKK